MKITDEQVALAAQKLWEDAGGKRSDHYSFLAIKREECEVREYMRVISAIEYATGYTFFIRPQNPIIRWFRRVFRA